MKTIRRNLIGWAFAAPAVLLIIVFLIYPTLCTVRLSLYDGIGFNPTRFVGLRNYARLFTQDPFFLKLSFPPSGSLINNVIWLISFPSLTIGLGLIIAILADSVRYEVVIKSIVFMPMAISATAAGVVWRLMYSPDPKIGLLNAILTTVSPGTEPLAWTGDPRIVTLAIIVASVWMSTGFAMVVLSAGIKAIPKELIEAAHVDGATGWQVFWRIQLQLLRPLMSFLLITDIIAVIKIYDLILVIGGKSGGPMGAARVIAFTQYVESFQNARVGYGSAIAVIMLLLILPLMAINVRRFRQEEEQR